MPEFSALGDSGGWWVVWRGLVLRVGVVAGAGRGIYRFQGLDTYNSIYN